MSVAMPLTPCDASHRPAYGGPVQHLIDPASCIRCEICTSTCPAEAILVIADALVVDPDRCHGAGPCLDACPTGAIANWRLLQGAMPYPIETQAAWVELPADRSNAVRRA